MRKCCNDWRIRINDSSDGGAEYYAVEDATAGRTPFRIEAGAIDNALYVDSEGDVGIGTSTPVVELHAVDGDTPTLRLEQDGSSGFTSQTFDLAGNEAGFFIRDVTNGSTLPFRIIPGASSEALVIDDDDDIGMSAGTNPTAALHVKRSDGSAQILIEEANTGALFRNLLKLDGGGLQTVIELNNSDTTVWEFAVKGTTSRFEINKQASGNPFQFLANGDLAIGGDYFSNTCVSGMPCAPDYVFESGYELMPLAELEAFVEREKHLPGIASADDIQVNGLNISQMQLRLLEKVEELTLHTISQQKTIEELKARVAALEGAEEQEVVSRSSRLRGVIHHARAGQARRSGPTSLLRKTTESSWGRPPSSWVSFWQLIRMPSGRMVSKRSLSAKRFGGWRSVIPV